MKNPSFSIIVPVYNAEKYIDRCIDSLIKQTYSDIEIILVNDGSTDKSGSICDEYASKDDRIKVIHQKNQGIAETRNVGIRIAIGDFIIFVDNDDILEKKSTEVFWKIIQENPDVEAIVGNHYSVINDKCFFRIKNKNIDKKLISGIDFLTINLLKRCFDVAPWLYIVKRDFILMNSLYFKNLVEDIEWTPKMLLLVKNVYISDFFHYFNFSVKTSASHINRKNRALDILQICKEHENLFNNIEEKEKKVLSKYLLFIRYLDAIKMGQLYKKESNHLVDVHFLKRNAVTKGDRFSLFVFLLSPLIYYRIVFKLERYCHKLLNKKLKKRFIPYETK
ncbi:MAG: glycosyltransferase [Candidatus Cloacimonetes bacterium]|nr:glycosyltransferase [Candidatus Cloacimonadota bacterium]